MKTVIFSDCKHKLFVVSFSSGYDRNYKMSSPQQTIHRKQLATPNPITYGTEL